MDAAADAARYQLKDEPESPFTVEFATEVLVEIRQLALEAFRSLPYGGLEIGGVLFGRFSPSGRNPKRVEVAATRPIECDHSAGPAFILSSAERVRLTQLFEHARHEEDLAALAVVGFWVSHGRSALGLTSHDVDLYRAFFPHPWQVALVLKPENRQPLREALFCRVNARVVPYRRPAEPVEAFSASVLAAPLPSASPAALPILSEPILSEPILSEPILSEPKSAPILNEPILSQAILSQPILGEPEPIAQETAPPTFPATFAPPATDAPAPLPETLVPETISESLAPEPEFYVPEYREPEHLEAASDAGAQTVPEPARDLAFPQQAFPAEPFRIPSFQERVWQEQALQEQAARHEPVEEESAHAAFLKPVIPEPSVMKPPTAAELPRFPTDIYLPTPPVEPPSTKTWAKDLYRPAGRARSLVQALPLAQPSPGSAPVTVVAPPVSEPVSAKADFVEEIPRLRSYWETEPEPQPVRNTAATVEADIQEHLQETDESPLQEPLPEEFAEREAVREEVDEHLEPAHVEPVNIAVLKPQDYDPNIPPSFDLPGPSAEVRSQAVVAQPPAAAPEPPALPAPVAVPAATVEAAPRPPALLKPVETPLAVAASIPAPIAPEPETVKPEAGKRETPQVQVAPAEVAKVEAAKAEAPAPPPAPVVQAAEIGDELARLLVSIRAAAADTKVKRPVVDDEDPAVHPARHTKHSFGLLTVVLLMIAGLVLGGVLGYWFFGNHQPVAAKAPGPDLGLEMFNTGKEVLIHWDAKSPLILNARAAELRIHDSGMVQTLLLDLSGLSRGYYRYQPTSSDVQTTLIVTENDGRAEQSNASRFAE